MEKEIRIQTPDKKIIYGVLRGSLQKPLIITVHGLPGDTHEALHYNAARYFEKAGFSNFRFNLYHWGKGARKLHECTLQTHGRDIDTVIEYFYKQKVKKVFLAGHSYGFPSILCSKNKNVNAIVSWDGTKLPHVFFDKGKHISKPKGVLLDYQYFMLIGEEMFKESHSMASEAILKTLQVPIKFITVGSKNMGNLIPTRKMYKIANQPKAIISIKGANHFFGQDGKQEILYKETVSWFKKFL